MNKVKVQCYLCSFESDGKCIKKKTKINLKKKRVCNLHELDDVKLDTAADKILEKKGKYPSAVFRPDEYWNRDLRRKIRKEAETKFVEERVKQQKNDQLLSSHPLTGDLSRFYKSTVSEGSNNGSNSGNN